MRITSAAAVPKGSLHNHLEKEEAPSLVASIAGSIEEPSLVDERECEPNHMIEALLRLAFTRP